MGRAVEAEGRTLLQQQHEFVAVVVGGWNRSSHGEEIELRRPKRDVTLTFCLDQGVVISLFKSADSKWSNEL